MSLFTAVIVLCLVCGKIRNHKIALLHETQCNTIFLFYFLHIGETIAGNSHGIVMGLQLS